MRTELLMTRLEDAIDEHAQVTRWKRDVPRFSRAFRVHRNRQWTIKRRINKYGDQLTPYISEQMRQGNWWPMLRIIARWQEHDGR